MRARFLLVRSGCPFCLQMEKVVQKINLKLDLDRKIQIIDCSEYEYFDLDNIPLIKKLEKDGLKEGYPYLYLDGIVIEPAATPEQLNVLLEEFLKNDLY